MRETRAGWPDFRGSIALAAVFSMVAVLWYVSTALVPMLLGALFGIFLRQLSVGLRRFVSIGERWAVSLTLVLLVAAAGLLGCFYGRRVFDQFGQLLDLLPQGVEAGRGLLERNPHLHSILSSMLSGQAGGSVQQLLRSLGSIVSVFMETGVAAFVAFFTGAFLAFNTRFYSAGVLALIPRTHRERWKSLLVDLWRTLWLWTLGRLLIMAIIAVTHIVAYWALGVPLPVALGVIAGLLSFIPFLGPVLATVPAGLAALTKSPSLLLWVIVVHAAVQMAESYLITPLAQEYLVDVPSLVTIGAFVLCGATLGVAGVIVAAPLAAALIVFVRHLYLPWADES